MVSEDCGGGGISSCSNFTLYRLPLLWCSGALLLGLGADSPTLLAQDSHSGLRKLFFTPQAEKMSQQAGTAGSSPARLK